MKFKTILLFVIFLGCLFLSAQNKFPQPTGWLNDYAGVLSEPVKQELTNWCTELKEKANVEMAIAIFPDIGGADYSNFATDLFRAWGVGNNKDEGALILVAVQERKIKFEIGYGSEGYWTDAYTAEVYRNMVSLLPKGSENYDEALRQASLMLLNRAAQEKGIQITGMPTFQMQEQTQSTRNKKTSIILVIIFIILMIVTRGRILYWLLLFSAFGGGRTGGGGFGGSGGSGSFGGGFGGFGGFGGGHSGGGGAGGGF
jgi:uncharacterized protein